MQQDNQQLQTYQTEPREEEKFYPSKVREVIRQVCEEYLDGVVYDIGGSYELTEKLTVEIRRRVREPIIEDKKEFRLNRYKLGVKIIYGNLNNQGVKVASKCFWDSTFDNYATYTYTNESLYAVGIVYGCYYE